jgi:glycosyltransferase involved in cell wall biosynthesis
MKILLSSNTAWYLWKFRLSLALALKAEGHEVVAVAPRDGHERKLEEAGIRFVDVALDNSGMNPVRDLRFLVRLFLILRRERPGAFLGYTIKPNVYGGLACRWLGIPSIHNVSGLGTAFMKKGILSRIACGLYRVGLGWAHRVFFQNAEDCREFLELRLVEKSVVDVLPGSGVDLERFAPTKRLPSASGEPVRFLLVARLIWDKGVGEYVEAARRLHRDGVSARFQLGGFLDVKNRTAISRADVDSWIRDGTIEYLGAADDVRPWMAEADCVVLPSYREGTPRSLLEAASMALPIVTTDAPGCRNVVQDGVNGFLCRARDAADLANKLRTMAELSPDQREAMGRASRAKMVEEYDERIVLQKYHAAIQAIEPVIQGRRSATHCS